MLVPFYFELFLWSVGSVQLLTLIILLLFQFLGTLIRWLDLPVNNVSLKCRNLKTRFNKFLKFLWIKIKYKHKE
jgi:hypothetical protein